MKSGLLALSVGVAFVGGCANIASAQNLLSPANPIQTEAERRAWSADDHSPKAIVDKFNQLAFFDGQPMEAMQRYLSDDFIERAPDFANDDFATDKEAMLNMVETRGQQESEQKSYKIYMVIAEGNLVSVFHHAQTSPADRGIAFVDMFRVVDGLIVEHWAVVQPVPEAVSARHSMF